MGEPKCNLYSTICFKLWTHGSGLSRGEFYQTSLLCWDLNLVLLYPAYLALILSLGLLIRITSD